MEAYFPHFNIRAGCELGRTCMLIYLVTLANAATSPIILPFALWWFIIGWVFWRYSILYVFERSTESGGMVSIGLLLTLCLPCCSPVKQVAQRTQSFIPGSRIVQH